MATSSITKEFIVKDKKVYEQFVADISAPSSEPKKNTGEEKDYLEEGRQALAKFSFR